MSHRTRTLLGYALLFVVVFLVASLFVSTATRADAAVRSRPDHMQPISVPHYPLHFGPSKQIAEPTHPGSYLRVERLADLPYGHLLVVFGNGARYDMAPCRYEDGHRCYWNAHAQGNHVGMSSFRLFNMTWNVN